MRNRRNLIAGTWLRTGFMAFGAPSVLQTVREDEKGSNSVYGSGL